MTRRRLLAGVAAAVLLGGGGWLWLRDSALVEVRDVRITGLSGRTAPRIHAALSSAAKDMTTLHVRRDQLLLAVEPYAAVADLRIETDFPHGMRIEVVPRRAVAVVEVDGRRVPIAADGTLLRGAVADGELPTIASGEARATGDRLSDRRAVGAAEVLGAAPSALLARAQRTYYGPRGLAVEVSEGPTLVFGSPSRARAKWAAVVAVLSDEDAVGARYIDVRFPERPAAGGLSPESGGAVANVQPQAQ